MEVGNCAECGLPQRECTCCEGCGHVCLLDIGEPFCPVCKPAPKKNKEVAK